MESIYRDTLPTLQSHSCCNFLLYCNYAIMEMIVLSQNDDRKSFHWMLQFSQFVCFNYRKIFLSGVKICEQWACRVKKNMFIVAKITVKNIIRWYCWSHPLIYYVNSWYMQEAPNDTMKHQQNDIKDSWSGEYSTKVRIISAISFNKTW